MIENMNEAQFIVELKTCRFYADMNLRYFSEQSRKYHRYDYWLKGFIGLYAIAGMYLAANPETRVLGAILAGFCAVLTANIMPVFKWDGIVSGFDEEEQDWIRIFNGYQDLLRVAEMSDRGEVLLQAFQTIREMQKTAALNVRHLPHDPELLVEKEAEVRRFYAADLEPLSKPEPSSPEPEK